MNASVAEWWKAAASKTAENESFPKRVRFPSEAPKSFHLKEDMKKL